ncbi:MAG: DUF6314 family protein [Pseudomonadota bacterium]
MKALIDFLGDWRVSRLIEDASGAQTRFEGLARLDGDAQAAVYEEKGQLQLATGTALQAERRYHWRESGEGVQIFFEDNRFFHALPKDGSQAEHFCDPDTYALTYDFEDWPNWRVDWRVEGPKKSYTARTTYRRLPKRPQA